MSQIQTPTVPRPETDPQVSRAEVGIGETIPLSPAEWRKLVTHYGPSVALVYAGVIPGPVGCSVVIRVETNGGDRQLYLPLTGSGPGLLKFRGFALRVLALHDGGNFAVFGSVSDGV